MILLRPLLLAFACLTAAGASALTNDTATTLLLRFENSLTGAAGENPAAAANVTFTPVVGGMAANFPTNANLAFTSTGNIGSQNGTLEFWIRPNWAGNDGQSHAILSWGGGGGFVVEKDGADNWRFIANRFGAGQPEVQSIINIGTWRAGDWHHAAFTWTPTSLKLYVDGVLRNQATITGLNAIPTGPVQIGNDGPGVFPIDATLDELRISNRERTAAEILQSYLGDRGLTGAPAFTVQPQSQTLTPGQALSLSVTTTGFLPVTYQWHRNGQPIPAATATNYSLTDLGGAQVANFTVVAANSFGATTSRVAAIVVDTGLPADSAYTLNTLAGTAEVRGYQDGQGGAARFNYPMGVAMAGDGTVFVGDSYGNRVRRVTPAGLVTTLAGTNTAGALDGNGNAAQFGNPKGLAIDPAGNVFVADDNNANIRKVTPTGDVTTFVGSAGLRGTTDATGTNALFYDPWGVAMDAAGSIYVADTGNQLIRKVSPTGDVTTLTGRPGVRGFADGAPGIATFENPTGVAVDFAGNVYVVDSGTYLVRKVTPDGFVTTLAGVANEPGYADGQGIAARFNYPKFLTVDGEGNVYVGDQNNHAIRKITPAGRVSTLLFQPGYSSTVETLWHPRGVAADAAGNVYVADYVNSTIRKATRNGPISPVVVSAPTDTVVDEGGTVTLTVTLASAGGATCQWMKDNVPLAGATFTTLRLTGITRSQAGRYTLVIQRGGVSFATRAALVSVRTPSDMFGRLLFSYKGTNQSYWNLWTVSAKGTGLAQLTTYTNAHAFYPRLSPNATRVVFTRSGSTNEGLNGLWVQSLTGGAAYQLLCNTNFNTNTVLSCGWLDENTILFNATRNGGVSALWQVSSAGGPPTERFTFQSFLTGVQSAGVRDVSPQRGELLLFHDQAGAYPSFSRLSATGSSRSLIYENLPPGRVWTGESGFGRWSPDGLSVGLSEGAASTYNFDPEPRRAIVVSSVAPRYRQLHPKTEIAHFRAWSPDGTRMLLRKFNYWDYGHSYGFNFADDREVGDFWVMEADGSNPRPITNLGTNLANGSVEWFIGAPEFTQEPVSVTEWENDPLTLAASTIGRAPITYQWLKNGVPVPGATNISLTFTALRLTDDGTYVLRASNLNGVTLSAGAVLTVRPAIYRPVFLQHPVGGNFQPGQSHLLSVLAANQFPLFYQWTFNGQPVAGATNTALAFNSLDFADSGIYRVVISNVHAAVTSAPAILGVYLPLAFASQPESATASLGDRLTFSATVSGSGPVTYQWVKDGLVIAGANQSAFTVDAVGFSDAGSYVLRASNPLGAVTSDAATLAVRSSPVILAPPTNRVVTAGGETTFLVAAAGTPPLTYQWRYSGTNLPGATSPSLTLTGIQLNRAGQYSVVVGNGHGTTTASALLQVLPLNATSPWSAAHGGSGDDSAKAVAVDAAGNSVVVGEFTGTSALGTNSLPSAGASDIFVARFNSAGVLQWARRFGGLGYDGALAVALDTSGNVFVAGFFERVVDFDATSLTNSSPSSYTDIFVAKLNASGQTIWASPLGMDGFSDTGRGIAVDTAGNVLVAGQSKDVTGTVAGRVYVAKLSSAGALTWERRFGSRDNGAGFADTANAVAADAAGNVLVAGHFGSPIATFGATTLTNAGLNDLFLAKLDANGATLWIRPAGASGDDRALAVAVAPGGTIHLGGQAAGTNAFAGFLQPGAGDQPTPFLARHDGNGTLLGVHQFRVSSGAVQSLAVDASGNAFLSGYFAGSFSYGSNNLTSLGGTYDAFVARVDVGGTIGFVQQYGGNALSGEFGYGVGVDAAANAFVTGTFRGNSVSLGGEQLASAGGEDFFLTRINAVSTARPSLAHRMSGTRLRLGWPLEAAGYVLQSAAGSPLSWADATNTVHLELGEFVITNDLTVPARFFRLRKP